MSSGEGRNAATGCAAGCKRSEGWVPYSGTQNLARRNPLIDAINRTDDPCVRPSYCPPHYEPEPKFSPIKQGDECDLSKFKKPELKFGPRNPGPATVTVQSGDPQILSVHLQPRGVYQSMQNTDTVQQQCDEARNLDTMRNQVNDMIGPHEELEAGMGQWAKCQPPYEPQLPKYPCRGVISLPSRAWSLQAERSMCDPSQPEFCKPIGATLDDNIQLTGREYTEGQRTSEVYRVADDLPARFDNPEWFKGYGAEKCTHPFYNTTSAEYGRFPPTAHTMTVTYHPRDNKFSTLLGKTGMFRNRSLNLGGHDKC